MTTSFMQEFMNGEKSAEEKNLMAAQAEERRRDVMTINAEAYTDEEADDDVMGCDIPTGGCGGGCGCRS